MPKVAEEWLNICGGCEVSILDIGEPLLAQDLGIVGSEELADDRAVRRQGELALDLAQ